MARIRFQGTSASLIPTPPTGKASLFFDNLDNALKLRLDDGSIVALGVSEEYIQDIIGTMFTDSAAIDATYNDAGNVISVDIKPNIITDYYVDKISPTKIIDAQNGRYEASVITNNNSPTTILSIDCALDGMWLVEARLTGRRIGGLSGSPGDGCVFKRSFRVRSISSSVTVHDIQSDYTSRDNPLMNVQVSVNSTYVTIKVVGVNNNNIKWNLDVLTNVNT